MLWELHFGLVLGGGDGRQAISFLASIYANTNFTVIDWLIVMIKPWQLDHDGKIRAC